MTSDLVKAQQRFALMVARLLLAADARGMPLRLGDAFRDERVTYGHPRSLHRSRLAVDLIADDDAHHVALHDLWDRMGGSERIDGDLNHYSYPWPGGVR